MVSRWLLLLCCAVALRAETVAFLGDSITAGYGLTAEEAYPALVEAGLRARPATAGWTVANGGVSGDTSAGGLRRIDWLLKAKPAVVVIVLGGNDGLRGLPVAALEANLRGIIAKVRATGAKPMLIGMRVPLNLGPDYAAAFAAVYPRLAAELDVPLLPFLLEGVAMQPQLNQADQIHPNAEGQRRVAALVLAWLAPLLEAK
jgi:acyl-CoA thioesterase-1